MVRATSSSSGTARAIIEPELNVALLTSDGRALEWWTDIAKTIASFARFSRRDADTLRRWHDEFVPIVAEHPRAGEPLAAAAAGGAARPARDARAPAGGCWR